MKAYTLPALVLTAILLLGSLCACHTPDDPEAPPQTPPSTEQDTPPVDLPESPEDEPTPPPAETPSITADLDHDGIDDYVHIILADDDPTRATLEIVSGKDGSILMSEPFAQDQDEKGGYYLRRNLQYGQDSLVYWSYRVTEADTLIFRCHAYQFNAAGEIVDLEKRGQTFPVTTDTAMLAHNDPKFVQIRETINALIMPNEVEDICVLLNNQGDTLLYSTPQAPIAPTEITFELIDFATES